MEIEDIPGNSRTRRPPSQVPSPAINASDKPEIEKVVTGEVRRAKPGLGKRFKEVIVGGDAHSVGGYILFDVLIPAFKDTVADAFSQGIEKLLFGEARSTSRRTGFRPSGGTTSQVSYNKYATPPWRKEQREEPRISRASRATHSFEEIILATRREAELVIDRMHELIERYGECTVSNLYELVGETGDFTDEKYGWTELRGAQVRRAHSGYMLDLPRPEPLE